MVVVEGVARKLNPETNIWETSRPVLENWLKETKDPINSLNETIKNTTEVIKRLPELPEIMHKANQALTYFASGQIPQNSNSYLNLNEKKNRNDNPKKSDSNRFIITCNFGPISILILFYE